MANKKNEDHVPIQWHTAAYAALQIELADYLDVLEFSDETQLSSKPLKIDVLIIKKLRDMVIEKNFARIFRTYNIVEYKSGSDYLSIGDLYKVYGYACLYSSLERKDITDITVTFVAEQYPRKVLTHLQEIRGFTLDKTDEGIYTIRGDVLPMQFIESKALSAADNLWLRNLRGKLDRESFSALFREDEKLYRKPEMEKLLDAYMHVVVEANADLWEKETMEMSPRVRKALEATGWTKDWEKKGEKRAAAKYKADAARYKAENAELKRQLAQLAQKK
ncbi:MAG: hypothetical protein LBM77_10105 [Spirochaetaceae bacterium]|jgi:hypothetical protein|nr:hypothetical protein [Spirochaetaceae bacterium]